MFPGNLLGEGEGTSQRELVSQKEISQSSNNLLDILQDETEAHTVMGEWWVGPLFEVDCLDGHVLGPSFRLKSHFRAPETDLGVCWISLSRFPM